MDWILNSKLYKGSKNKEKILAAFQNPVNHELVKQLSSYVDPEYKELTEEVEDTAASEENVTSFEDGEGVDVEEHESSPNRKSPNGGFSKPRSFSGPSSSPSFEDNAEVDVDTKELEPEDNSPQPAPDTKDDDVESSTKISVTSSTYVSVETVSQAVNEIPGMLNLREDTAGVTYATLKGGSDNEVWIYYNSDVDINQVLDKVNLALVEASYYFLEFNRVVRDKNAIVFSINWVSTYFNPVQLKDVENQ